MGKWRKRQGKHWLSVAQVGNWESQDLNLGSVVLELLEGSAVHLLLMTRAPSFQGPWHFPFHSFLLLSGRGLHGSLRGHRRKGSLAAEALAPVVVGIFLLLQQFHATE